MSQWKQPDLGFAVMFLSRYCISQDRSTRNVLRSQGHLRYFGINYSRDEVQKQKSKTLYALPDSDFAGCKDTALSTSGFDV